MFKPIEVLITPNRLEFAKGFPFELELGRKMVQELGSFMKWSRNFTTQTCTPKFVEEVATKVMQANKVIELF